MRYAENDYKDSPYVFNAAIYDDLIPPYDEIFDFMGVKFDDNSQFTQPIVYTYYDQSKHPLYVGKTTDFLRRHAQHHARSRFFPFVCFVGLQVVGQWIDMSLLEVLEIHAKRPKYNRDLNEDFSKYVILGAGIGEIEVTNNIPECIFTIDAISSFFTDH